MTIIKQSQNHRKAFTRLECAIVILILTAALAYYSIQFHRPRRIGTHIVCINHLKNLGLAFRCFATDNVDLYPMKVSTNWGGSAEWNFNSELFLHFVALSNEISTPKVLVCPFDSKRTPATNFTNGICNTNVSYFLVPEATESEQVILSGDRNILSDAVVTNNIYYVRSTNKVSWSSQFHKFQGNILFGDGHAEKVFNTNMPSLLQKIVTPFRLALPE